MSMCPCLEPCCLDSGSNVAVYRLNKYTKYFKLYQFNVYSSRIIFSPIRPNLLFHTVGRPANSPREMFPISNMNSEVGL